MVNATQKCSHLAQDLESVVLSLTVALLVFTEVVADETPAVQAVLKADTKRLKLLEEEKRLQALLEKGDDTAGEKLEKVFVDCGEAVAFVAGLANSSVFEKGV